MPACKFQTFANKGLCILVLISCFTITAFSQKKLNPTIGKKEFDVSLFLHSANSPNYSLLNLISTQIVYRWPWQKNTKFGVGGVAGVIDHDPIHELDVVAYGALFGDITQFIDHRQKWSASGQAGHGIFKRKNEFQTATYKGVDKHTAGMYYSISINYRSIISKKVLMVISPVYTFINFRQKAKQEIYSPPSVEEYKLTSKYSGPGLKFGIVF